MLAGSAVRIKKVPVDPRLCWLGGCSFLGGTGPSVAAELAWNACGECVPGRALGLGMPGCHREHLGIKSAAIAMASRLLSCVSGNNKTVLYKGNTWETEHFFPVEKGVQFYRRELGNDSYVEA